MTEYGLDGVGVRDVRLEHERSRFVGSVCRRLPEELGAPPDQGNPRAVSQHRERCRSSDARARTGDEHDFSVSGDAENVPSAARRDARSSLAVTVVR